MKRIAAVLVFLLLLAALGAAAGEVTVSVSPENPRVGDYVDVTVTPEREGWKSITWAMTVDGEKSITYKNPDKKKGADQHLAVSFRPRKEGSHVLKVTVSYGGKDKETVEITVPVSGDAPAQEGTDVVYSQKDGWWYRKKYSSTRDLQKAGCAIFTMSHALQRMGYTDENVLPEKIGRRYSYFYREGEGTNNEGLVNSLGTEYDYISQSNLIRSAKEIASSLRQGDYFSFSIVDGHIALCDGISEDGTKLHIVDSAAGATYERIRFKGNIFYRNEDGTFTEAPTAEDLPGIRWFFETQEYGGMEYWMNIDYCANRGMRLIRRPWLKADLGDGPVTVEPEYVGAIITKVKQENGAAVRIPTAQLKVTATGAVPSVALVTAKNGTTLKDGNGKKIAEVSKIPNRTMMLALSWDEDLIYVWWNGQFGYLLSAEAEVLPVVTEKSRTGLIAKNGSTSGAATVTARLNPKSNSTGLKNWKTGTPVALVETQGSFCLVEAKGLRAWVPEKNILWDQQDEPEEITEEQPTTEGEQDNGQKIDEGK